MEQQANNTSAAVNSLQEEITELRREINTQNNQSNARIVLPIELSVSMFKFGIYFVLAIGSIITITI